MTETPDRSDQRPEEAPPDQVPDDTDRSAGDDSPGVPGGTGTATGNPDAAGADEEGEAADEKGRSGPFQERG